METERQTLVTSEDEIRVGDLLELRSCAFCRSTHHQFVLASKRFSDDRFRYFDVTNSCAPYPLVHYAYAIAERRLYRIETGLLDEENPYAAHKKSEVTRQMAGRSKRIQQKARP